MKHREMKTRKKSRRLRKLLVGLALTIFVAVLLLAAVFTILTQTETGTRILADTINRTVSTSEFKIKVDGIKGPSWGGLETSHLLIGDKSGWWLEATGLSIDWEPFKLFEGTIKIGGVRLKALKLNRLPESGPAKEDKNTKPFRLSDLKLPPLAIDEVKLDRIEIGEPILGSTRVFDLNGRLDATGERVNLELNLSNLEGPTELIQLKADLNPKGEDLVLGALLREDAGGLIARLAKFPAGTATNLELQGRGSPDSWNGRLNFDLTGMASGDLKIGLKMEGSPQIEVAGDFSLLENLLPEAAADYTGRQGRLLVRVQKNDPGVKIDELVVETDRLIVGFKGDLNLKKSLLDLKYSLVAKSLSGLYQKTGLFLNDNIWIRGGIRGGFQNPEIDLKTTIDRFAVSKVNAQRIDLDLLTKLTSGQDGARSFDFEGKIATGRVSGLELPFPLDRSVTEFSFGTQSFKSFEVKRLVVDLGWVHLVAGGNLDSRDLALNTRFEVNVPKLNAITPLDKAGVNGGLVLRGRTQGAYAGLGTEVTLSATLDELTGLPRTASEFLGRRVVLEVEGLASKTDFKLAKLRLAGQSELVVSGGADLGDRTLQAAYKLTVPFWPKSLAEMGLVLDEPVLVEGSVAGWTDDMAVTLTTGSKKAAIPGGGRLQNVSLNINVTGFPANTKTSVRAGIDGFSLSGTEVRMVALKADLTGLPPQMKVDLDTNADFQKSPIELSTSAEMDGEKINLARLKIQAPGLSASGQGVYWLKKKKAQGMLELDAFELNRLGQMMNLPTGGKLKARLNLEATPKGQLASLTATGSGLAYADLNLDGVELSAKLADLFRKPSIDLAGTVKGLSTNALMVDQAKLNLQGGLQSASFDLAAKGQAASRPLDIVAAGTVGQENGRTTLTLNKLNGGYQKISYRLTREAKLTTRPWKDRPGSFGPGNRNRAGQRQSVFGPTQG